MARAQVAAMIAQEKELELDAAETKKLAGEWGRKAERAVTAGKDDLAREALRRRRDNEENSAIYSEQLGVQTQAVAKLKDQLRQSAVGAGDGEITGERGSEGLRAVRYALLADAEDRDGFGLILDWEGERQAFVGRRAEPLDIELFRRVETAG